MSIGIIDYGVGNFGSVAKSLEILNVNFVLIKQASELSTVKGLILPGVGSFAECAKLLAEGGWTEPIRDQAMSGKPLLGICLGMQLLATYGVEGAQIGSHEYTVKGLDLIPGRVISLREVGCRQRIPHVGWNEIEVKHLDQTDHRFQLFYGIPDKTDFYFVHSYTLLPDNPDHVLAETDYGINIVSAVGKGNVLGTQFHPEKSSKAGTQVIRNFVKLALC